jgi:hypothetical protein
MQSVHLKSNEYDITEHQDLTGEPTALLMTVTSLRIDVSRETLLLASDERLPYLHHTEGTN